LGKERRKTNMQNPKKNMGAKTKTDVGENKKK